MGQRRTFRSKQTDAGDASRVAVLTFAPTTSIDDPISTAVTPVTTDGNDLSSGSVGSVTHVHIASGAGATRIALANSKRVSISVYADKGKARLGFDNTVSSSAGRPLLTTASMEFGCGPGVYLGELWASDTGVDLDLYITEWWNA